MLLALPKQPQNSPRIPPMAKPPQQPPRIPAILGGVRVIVVQQTWYALRPCRAPPQILHEHSRGCRPDLLALLRRKFDGRGTVQWPSEVGRIYAARSLPKTLQISEAPSSPQIPTEIATIRPLSQAHLHQPIPGCTDKAQKQLAILLQHSCRFKRAHRCVLFARQLGCFESAIFRPPPQISDLWPKKAAVVWCCVALYYWV